VTAFSSRETLALLALTALCLGTYWVGLSGGFVFDDGPTFYYIQDWLAGKTTLIDAVLWNQSSSPLDKRSLAMASFALSAWIGGGLDPFVFKLHNLLLHCATAAAIYGLCCALHAQDPELRNRNRIAALAVATTWLLHPLHVSTVLYSVQRMAQISALCTVLGMWLYMAGRMRILSGKATKGSLALLLGVPVLTGLAIQGKQNGAVLPLLCLALEFAYFRHTPRPAAVRIFAILYCALPAVAVVAILAFRPSLLMAGYAEYDFTWWERLLTQGRALMGYVGQTVIPHTPSMGLATDAFQPSRGLFDPVTTALSLLALVVLSIGAFAVRTRMPTVLAGWCVFILGHAVEGSFLPLELYYEHRNLLPSLGLILIAVSVAARLGRWLSLKGVRVGRIGIVAASALVLALALMTHGRARVWSDPLVLFQSELKAHPDSYRAIVNYVGTASDVGDVDLAYAVTRERRKNAESVHLRGRMYLLHLWLDCRHNKEKARPEDLSQGIRLLPHRIEVGTFLLFDLLTQTAQAEGCGRLDTLALADAYRAMADHASETPDSFIYKAAFRANSALRFAEAGRWNEAYTQARLGWQKSTPPLAASALIEIMLVNGDLDSAQRAAAETRSRRVLDKEARQALQRVMVMIAKERENPGWNRRRVQGAAQ
jgi:hypothetical protein